MFGVEFVGSLSPNFNARDRRSCANDSLDDFFDLIGDLRNSFADRSTDMISDRDSADFSQTMIDVRVATVWGEERKANRRGIINELKLGGWFVPPAGCATTVPSPSQPRKCAYGDRAIRNLVYCAACLPSIHPAGRHSAALSSGTIGLLWKDRKSVV